MPESESFSNEAQVIHHVIKEIRYCMHRFQADHASSCTSLLLALLKTWSMEVQMKCDMLSVYGIASYSVHVSYCWTVLKFIIAVFYAKLNSLSHNKK